MHSRILVPKLVSVNTLLQRAMSGAAFKPLKIGLTGSIGMGKSTISKQFKLLGFPLFDADAAVHEMYGRGGRAVDPIAEAFPGSVVDGTVDRQILGSMVLSSPDALDRLESIIHPLVAEERESFYGKAAEQHVLAVVYDIPLLYEKNLQGDVDVVVVVTASAATQRERVLNRPGASVERFESILSTQLPDEVKRERADYVIDTDFGGYAEGRAQLSRVIENLIERHPEHYQVWKRIFGLPRESQVIGEGKSSAISSRFELVVFDLDDTLAPVMGAVGAGTVVLQSPHNLVVNNVTHIHDYKGNAAMFAFMKEHMIETSQTPPHELRSLMKRLVEESPLIAHDFGELRKAALKKIASLHGEDHKVEEAVEVFGNLRSDLDGHLYADALPCLDWLRQHHVKSGVFTNSNAAVSKNSVLGKQLEIYLHAGEVGASKPSPVPFLAISQRTGINPSRILYVGDSYHHDVVGAHLGGLATAYLRRDGVTDRTYTAMLAKYNIAPDITLTTLDPLELSEKIDTFVRTSDERRT